MTAQNRFRSFRILLLLTEGNLKVKFNFLKSLVIFVTCSFTLRNSFVKRMHFGL